MSRSDDPGNFFQTSTSLENADRKAVKAKSNAGNPIKIATSKILAVLVDPLHRGRVYLAESGGCVRRFELEDPALAETQKSNGSTLLDSARVFKTTSSTPVTCLALSTDGSMLLAGCWDKNISAWKATDVSDVLPGHEETSRLPGFSGQHTDFVKAIQVFRVPGRKADVLISSGADGRIVVWDGGSRDVLHVIRAEGRGGISTFALDPLSPAFSSESTGGQASIDIFSAGSEPMIRRWRLRFGDGHEKDKVTTEERPSIAAHETNIAKLWIEDNGDNDGGEMWTASADRSCRCLERKPGAETGWKETERLEHPDFVRDVCVFADRWVITACRDEEIRVWDKGSGQLYHTFSGHFEEVTGLAIYKNTLISVSIDMTVRRWDMESKALQKAKDEAKNQPRVEETDGPKVGLMTEEEERELEDLMDDSD